MLKLVDVHVLKNDQFKMLLLQAGAALEFFFKGVSDLRLPNNLVEVAEFLTQRWCHFFLHFFMA